MSTVHQSPAFLAANSTTFITSLKKVDHLMSLSQELNQGTNTKIAHQQGSFGIIINDIMNKKPTDKSAMLKKKAKNVKGSSCA
jgi:hypothetical protein